MVVRIYGILIIYYKMWVMADVSIVMGTDIKYAIGYMNKVVGNN